MAAVAANNREEPHHSQSDRASRPGLIERMRVLAVMFKQAGDVTRLRLLLLLRNGERHVNSLCDSMGDSPSKVSHHLSLLRAAGLVTPTRKGKLKVYSLTVKGRSLADCLGSLL